MRRIPLPPLLIAAATLALAAPEARANVSLKNGNFFIGYTDAVYPGGFELKLERVYNSKTPFKGIFGWGWGNEFEVYLTIMGDGSVVAHEYGGGAENSFSPTDPDPVMLDAALKAIARAAVSRKHIREPDVPKYTQRLRTDRQFRNDEWSKYVKSGDVQPRRLEPGTHLTSMRFSKQAITRTETGYRRTFDNGRVETYDDQGRLVRVTDSNKNFIRFEYDSFGRMSLAEDDVGRKLRFYIGARGLVDSLQIDDGRRAKYRYNARDELVWTRDVDGNVYTHAYSADGRHNMTRIGYADGTSMEMVYHPRTMYENIKSVKDRDGSLTTYEYVFASRGDTSVQRVTLKIFSSARAGSARSQISRSVYEYHLLKDATGAEWTRRMITDIDGDRTETVYAPGESGVPVLIARGADTTRFVYDADGHVTRKETPTEVTVLAYDPAVSKVSRVQRTPKVGGEPQSSEFRYDERANLIRAWNSAGDSVSLTYDDKGRIVTMTDTSGTLSFVYNKNSKPTEIKHSEAGRIVVTYTPTGEIEKVTTPDAVEGEGRKVALKVTGTFQRLLDIIRPAGVSLSF
jgi:YD repeat-containing protein